MRKVYISIGVMIVLGLAGLAGLAWAGSKVYVGAERPSDSLVPLDQIDHAIVCASIGCPRLRNEAYVPKQMEEQLADNTRDFFSRRQHFHADAPQRTVYVSSILKWFSGDFGPTAKQGLISLADYLPDDASRRMIRSGDFSVHYLDYDWNLNDRPGAPTTTTKR